MTCPCPKCTAPIEQDQSKILDEESTVACPACKAKVLLVRESFARRAYRKSGEIQCSECGNPLGDFVNCPSCGALYPDDIVADTPEAVRRRKRSSKRWEPFKGLEFSLRPTQRGGDTGYVPQRVASGTPDVVASTGSRNILIGVISLVIGLAVLAGGVGAYHNYQTKRRYAENYTKALYVYTPRPSAEDVVRLGKVKGQVDNLMQKVQHPPGTFAAAGERLMKLNGVYGKAHALALAPPGSQSAFRESTAKLQDDFTRAAQELKSTLPEPLAEELKKAQLKYKGLRDL
jgi:hypothetical protein